MQEKGTFFQLAQLCSQTVFLIFWGGLKNAICAENTLTIVVSAYYGKAQNGQKCQIS